MDPCTIFATIKIDAKRRVISLKPKIATSVTTILLVFLPMGAKCIVYLTALCCLLGTHLCFAKPLFTQEKSGKWRTGWWQPFATWLVVHEKNKEWRESSLESFYGKEIIIFISKLMEYITSTSVFFAALKSSFLLPEENIKRKTEETDQNNCRII